MPMNKPGKPINFGKPSPRSKPGTGIKKPLPVKPGNGKVTTMPVKPGNKMKPMPMPKSKAPRKTKRGM